MPEINFNRPKKGFSFPLQKWLRQDLKNWANEHIYENNYEFINKKNIIKNGRSTNLEKEIGIIKFGLT